MAYHPNAYTRPYNWAKFPWIPTRFIYPKIAVDDRVLQTAAAPARFVGTVRSSCDVLLASYRPGAY